MLYSVINRDGFVLYESNILSDVTQYVATHQSGSQSDPDYAYAVIDRSDEINTVSYVLMLTTANEPDVIAKLASEANVQNYIISLIRADIS